MSDTSPMASVPAHIPADLVIDWDFHAPPGGERALNSAWKSLHEGPDIVWTGRNGGHWIVTRAEDIEFVQRNHDPFSMREITIPAGIKPLRSLPLEADPPEHAAYRKILVQFFTPKAIGDLSDSIRALTVSLIEGFYARGKCELVADFAMRLPITIFMKMIELPLSDLERLLAWTEATVRPKKPDDMRWAFLSLNDYLTEVIRQRRSTPGSDLISAIVNAQVFGREITDEEMRAMLFNVVFGGLDTVASIMGFAADFLARSPAHRLELAEHPERIPGAVDELLRVFAPSSTGRVVTRDYQYKDVTFKKGDRVYVRPLLHGMDERRFAEPLKVDFSRPQNQHAGFGSGPHKCVGAVLARVELRIFLEEWIKRIPNFELQEGADVRFSAGMVNCVLRVPLTWSPVLS